MQVNVFSPPAFKKEMAEAERISGGDRGARRFAPTSEEGVLDHDPPAMVDGVPWWKLIDEEREQRHDELVRTREDAAYEARSLSHDTGGSILQDVTVGGVKVRPVSTTKKWRAARLSIMPTRVPLGPPRRVDPRGDAELGPPERVPREGAPVYKPRDRKGRFVPEKRWRK
jgi:hypothetical protein